MAGEGLAHILQKLGIIYRKEKKDRTQLAKACRISAK